jgi:hypothetical protein
LKIEIAGRNTNSFFQRLIPDDNFEWKSGIRLTLYIFVPLWILGFFCSFFIGSVRVVLFILGIIVIGFYESSESLQILFANNLSPAQFLRKKVWNHLLIFIVVFSPLVLSFVVFHPELYYIPLIELAILTSIFVYKILLKYSFYKPNEKSPATQLFSNIAIISLFVPILIPVVIGISVRLIFMANKKLKFYLND